ncbi:unnamed protein product [Meloidogyne enterolobii]|uniref:Uncharacterized protein n=1 Tax=Meloidogyne enterolobii TaxID=390850 RepID=A0ACB1AB22_MELEN
MKIFFYRFILFDVMTQNLSCVHKEALSPIFLFILLIYSHKIIILKLFCIIFNQGSDSYFFKSILLLNRPPYLRN